MSLVSDLRSVRIGPFAVFDFATAYAGAWFVSPYIHAITRDQLLWLVLPTAVIVHKLLGLNTPLNQLVFGPDANHLVQILILFMVYKGLLDKKL